MGNRAASEVKPGPGEVWAFSWAATAFDGYMGLRRDQRYTGTVLDDGRVRVAAVGALPGSGVHVSAEEWGRWFTA